MANDFDIKDGDALKNTTLENFIFGNVSHGTLVKNSDSITYTPNPNYNGADQLTYQIKDADGVLSNTASISFNIAAVAAEILTQVLNEDSTLNINLLAGSSDADGDALTAVKTSDPLHGTLITNPDGTLKYTPNQNFFGLDSFTYSISDSNGASVIKTLNIAVTSVNDVPVAAEILTQVLNEDSTLNINLLAGSSDADGDALTAVKTSDPLHGTLITNPDGTLKYTPNQNFFGLDSFTYSISDSNGASVIKTLNIAVISVNDAVVINHAISTQSAKLTKEFIFKLPDDLISNVDGDSLQIQIKKADGSALPSWLIFNPETLELRGTPPSSAYGLQKLSLLVSDGISEVKSDFNLVIDADLEAKTGANVITVDANNSAVSSSSGNVADLVLGDNRDNILEFKSDGNWTNPSYYAWNPYTNDRVSIHTQIRSFDAFDGRGGYDILNLTSGNDTIFLDDRFSANGSKSGARLANIEEIYGSEGNDVIDLSSNIFIYDNIILKGEAGNDLLWSNDGDDTIRGGSGNDNINGGRGNDQLSGDEGDDSIKGFDGDDIINGGAGRDTLVGGKGNDVFVFSNLADSSDNASDLILDFVKGEDKIDLSNLDINSSSLTHHFVNNQTIIEDQNSDFLIKLAGEIQLTQQDFIF